MMKATEIPLLETSSIGPVAKSCLLEETAPGFCLWNGILLPYMQVSKQTEAAQARHTKRSLKDTWCFCNPLHAPCKGDVMGKCVEKKAAAVEGS